MTLVRHLRFATLLAAGFACSMLAQAATYSLTPFPSPISVLPLTPLLGQPSGSQRAAPNTTRPTFTWTQGGLVTTFPQPATATYFMVCVYPAGGSCTWPGTWNAAATNIPRNEIITWTGIRTGRYSYTFLAPATLPANLLDVDLMWNVGACSNQAQNSCKLGTAKPLLFSTRNLVATDVELQRSSDSAQGWIRADLIVKNDGTTATGAFTTGLLLYQVRTDGTNCITNPAAPEAQSNDEAILANGEFVPVDSVPANATVVGITNLSLHWTEQTVNSNSLGAGIEFSVGAIETTFTWNSGETARAYVGGGFADNLTGGFTGPAGSPGTPGNPAAVKEFSEADNTRVKCKVVFR